MTKQIPVTGSSVLRQACAARNRKLNLATMAKEELQISAEALHRFIDGGTLPPDVMQRLCTALWSGAVEYDPIADRLRPGRRAETLPTPIRPPAYEPKPAEHLKAHQRLRLPADPYQPARTRPGWAE